MSSTIAFPLAPPVLERIGVIVNPRSKKNLLRPDRWRHLQTLLRGTGQVRVTRSLAEAYDAVLDFVRRRYTYVVADGGDGTLHCIVNLVREALEAVRGRPSAVGDHPDYPVILPANGGTINAIARRAGIVGHTDGILKVLHACVREGRPVPLEPVESLFVEGTQLVAGREVPFRRIAFGAAVAGVAQHFFREYYAVPVRGPKRIAQIIARICGSLIINSPAASWCRFFPPEAYRYADEFVRPRPARVWVDGRELRFHRHNVLNIGAFPFHLGALHTFRHARNGRLHLHAGRLSRFELVVHLPQILAGWIVRAPHLYDGPARDVRVECVGELLDPHFDGEAFHGFRSLTVSPGPPIPMARIVCTGPA